MLMYFGKAWEFTCRGIVMEVQTSRMLDLHEGWACRSGLSEKVAPREKVLEFEWTADGNAGMA